MRSANPFDSSARLGSLLAALALLLVSVAGPPAFAQAGGAQAPDPAPGATAPPAPDPAPGPNSAGEASPPATTSPGSTPPDTTPSAPQASTPVAPAPSDSAPSQPAAVPRGSQPPRDAAGKRGRPKNTRDTRDAGQRHQRSEVARPSPSSVFRASLPLSAFVGRDTDAERPPVELIAFALLTLVLAGAAFLTLTTRLTRMAGLAPLGKGPAS
jgi:hypothetical protein